MRYPITYCRLLARELRLDAAGQARLLAGTRLTPADLVALDRQVSPQDQITVIANALRIATRPGFGLTVGNRLPVAAHGMLGQLLAASPTLGDAWAALERFHVLRVPLVTLHRVVQDDHVDIRLTLQRPLDEVGLFLLEAMVVTVQRGIELVTGQRLRDARLTLGYPAPPHADAYDRVLHSPYAFDAPHTAWQVPLALMARPNPLRDDAAWRDAWRQCEQAMPQGRHAGARDGWRQRVADLLRAHPGVLWTQADVAAHFHVSTRTLIRHLKAEGTAWKRLLDAELAQQAAQLIAQGHSVESAAVALGYRDATAFRRAFRRWHGLAPMAWLAANGALATH